MQAQTVSQEEDKYRAETFIRHNVSYAKGHQQEAADVTLAYQKSVGNDTYYYVFNCENNGGYVIVGGDERAKEILGYSSEGTFDYATAPADLKWWLTQYDLQIRKAVATSGGTSLSLSLSTTSGGRTDIEPLMSTKWAQEAPFNLGITQSVNSLYAGCVAVAGAQVMKKWEYPVKGNNHAFDAATYGSYTAVAVNTGMAYDWTNMKDVYTYLDDDYTDASCKAVADLVYSVGRSCDMNYSTSGSSASAEVLGAAMISDFGYDKGMTAEYRDMYTDDDWESLVYTELANGRPVIYSGASDEEGGHCFVCDGYNSDDNTFHINWGWRGYCDNYFVLTATRALLPYSYTDDEAYGFTHSQGILKGVCPDNGGILRYAVSYSSPSISVTTGDRGATIRYSCTADNLTLADVNVPVGIVLTDTETGETTFTTSYNSSYIGSGLGSYYLMDMYFYIPTSLNPGSTYSVALAYKDENDQWQKAICPLSTSDPALTVNTPANDLYLVSDPSVGESGDYTTVDDFEIVFHVKNQSTSDITTALSFTLYKVQGLNGTYAGYCSLPNQTFKAGAVTDISIEASDIKYSGLSAGNKYTVALKDATNSYDICKAFSYNFNATEKINIDYALSSVGWGTVCLPFTADIPSGLKAYSIVGASGSELVKQEVSDGKFQMNTPYIINGESGTYSFSGPDTPRDIYTSGLLTGITEESTESSPIYAPANSYILAVVDGVLGFYKLPSQLACRQYSAYLKLGAGVASLPYFTFTDDVVATDIKRKIVETVGTKVYNIMGQRVSPHTRGIVIINGRKYCNRF